MRFKSRSRALVGSALAASLGLAGLALTASPAMATEATDVVRVAGTTRYGTAAEAATAAYPGGSTDVVLASGEKFPDALAGGGLAGSLDAPILLTQQNALPAETTAALAELNADNVTILGGTSAVSASVETALETAGYTVDRVGGVDRFETAALIAEELGGTTAVLANGLRFPDALAISPGAHKLELPLLLTTVDGLHEDAAAYIDANAVDEVIIVGGTAVVSQATEDALEADGITVTRLAGADRYASSVEIAEFHVTQGFTLARVVMATGEKFPDALAGGPYASQLNAPMVLTQTATLTPVTASFLTSNCQAIDALSILGGTAAITTAVETAAAAAARCAAPASATIRPELVSAQIVGTTTNTQATASNPEGTRVRFVFDEAVTGAAPNATLFHVYSFTGTQYNGVAAALVSPIVEAGGNSVIVNFPTLNTAALAANLTVATVDLNAVTDNTGVGNPEGDAPIGTARTDNQGAAGVTAAPDLVSVSGFRTGQTAGTTAVDFTFDEAAYVVTNTGFHLIRTNGAQLDCTGPAAGTLSPGAGGPASGEAVVGGNGTTTITVLCTNPAGVTTIASTDIARGTVDVNTVRDGLATPAGTDNNNPLQAADVANGGNTATTPDLVSAELRPGATLADADAVLYTFDEPVTVAPVSTLFFVYNAQGDELAAPAASATRNPDNASQVLVTFGTGNTAVDTAVGASVTDGAVTGSTGASLPNQQDEVGVSNPSQVVIQPGRTTGPDLVSVALQVSGTNPFTGAPNAYRAIYTFDEALTATTNNFFLYTAAGERLTTTNCVVGGPTNTGPTTVRCDGFTGTAVNGGTVSGAGVGGAVLGTVDNGAVTAADGAPSNPEGAASVTAAS